MSFSILRGIQRNYKNILHVHYFESGSRKLFYEGKWEALITHYNGLQCLTRCYKNFNLTASLKVAQKLFFAKRGDQLL